MFKEPEEVFANENLEFEEVPKPKSSLKKILTSFVLLGVFIVFSWYFISFIQTPPASFRVDKPITIEQGTGLRAAIKQIKEAGLIRSEVAMYLVMLTEFKDESIKANTYIFREPLSLGDLASELVEGGQRSDLVRITNIEGESAAQIAAKAAQILPNFNEAEFLTLAKPYEGKLFPETYLVPSDFTATELFDLLRKTFDEKIAPEEEMILKHELTLDEIIILASILEREANSLESKKMVSGILQKRLAISMPLQVDASLEYILNKPLKDLTAEDLDIDSPYNTYLNYGLPPTAIGNPGLDAIEAVLYPEESDYLFYITGDDGNFYYAKNFDAHRANIAKYLR